MRIENKIIFQVFGKMVPYIIGSVGENIRCCDYKTFGSRELAEDAYNLMASC